MAGRVSSTVRPAFAPVIRTGATSWWGSTCCLPSGGTSYTLANRTASGEDDVTLTLAFGAPVTVRAVVTGAESKCAYWPGKSSESPTPSPESWESAATPGTAEIAGGAPPAGFSTVCSRPVSASGCPPLSRPG